VSSVVRGLSRFAFGHIIGTEKRFDAEEEVVTSGTI
jgi:hypothetical protein